MKRLPFIDRPYRNAARLHLKWQVVGNLGNGERPRRFFKTRGEAKAYAHLKNTEFARHGQEATQLSNYDFVMAKRCRDDLAALGLTIEDATRAAIDQENARRKSCAIEAVSEQFIDSLVTRKVTKWTINSFRRLAKRLCEAFPGKFISDFTTRDLEDFLTGVGPNWSARSRNQHRSQLTSLWAYAEKHGYCLEKTARNIGWVKEIETTIGILQPSDVGKLLAIAPPKLIVGLAIGFFAGLRVSEICRLDWSEIDLRSEKDPETGGCGFIRVMPEKAKTARNRFVTILPNLAAWLRPFQKNSGKVVIASSTVYFDELRQSVAARAGIVDWPNNALRHSYASYHYAHFRDLGDLIVQMGHIGPRQIFAHYRKLVRPDAAPEYWQIAPFSRPEVAEIYALTPEAYPWCVKPARVVIDDTWIDGVQNLTHFFGVDKALAYYWFNHMKDCPQRPADDRFHIRTWAAFVKKHAKIDRTNGQALFYTSWYHGDRSGEQREYFHTEREAIESAASRNRKQLAEELCLKEIENVIAITKFLSADTSQSPIPPRTNESANSVG